MPRGRGRATVRAVLHEFKEGTLHSGQSKTPVKNPKQAIAIALSEAGLSRRQRRKRRS